MSKGKPRVLVLTGYGINCDAETASAFERAGAHAEPVHLKDILHAPEQLETYHILAIPGGFSFGDDVASGRILANRLRFKLGEPLAKFAKSGKLIIGICNGFQVMVKMGLLPFSEQTFTQEVTLTHNDSNRFENRWVNLRRDPSSACIWLEGIEHIELPVRHGEGRVTAGDTNVLARLAESGQIPLRYARSDQSHAEREYPANPNGSEDDVAAICDASGRIFGLMPHPEAFVDGTNHPRWYRGEWEEEGAGLKIFRNAVAFASKHLVQDVAKHAQPRQTG